MASIYPDEGLPLLIFGMIESVEPISVRLYTNAINPTPTTVAADLVEAAWAGYAPVAFNAVDVLINTVIDHAGVMIFPIASFANTSGAPVVAQGAFVLGAGGQLLQVSPFVPAETIPDAGAYDFTPLFTTRTHDT